jgi:hypothetical protein
LGEDEWVHGLDGANAAGACIDFWLIRLVFWRFTAEVHSFSTNRGRQGRRRFGAVGVADFRPMLVIGREKFALLIKFLLQKPEYVVRSEYYLDWLEEDWSPERASLSFTQNSSFRNYP